MLYAAQPFSQSQPFLLLLESTPTKSPFKM
jgi:hypothetical protein